MEIDGNMFGHNSSSSSSRGQNGNHLPWNIWGSTSTNANANNLLYLTAATAAVTIAQPPSGSTTCSGSSAAHALFHHQQQHDDHEQQQQDFSNFYGCGGDHIHHNHHRRNRVDGSHYLLPDPHLMCLKLGKRQYFEDAAAATSAAPPPPQPAFFDRQMAGGYPLGGGGVGVTTMKRGKNNLYAGGGGSATTSSLRIPRCQVEGCHVVLMSAKEYHRRHKVCEMHSKASKVIVSGLEQRFCQQCSRFHVVSEFDESKRSCRRRLAGHNERRRKCSHDSLARSSSQEKKLMMAAAGRFSYLSTSPTARGALSLLSSSKSSCESWVSPSDISSRSRAALHELMEENRAAILARQLISSSERSNSNWECHSTQDLGDHPSQSWPSNSGVSHQQQQQYFSDDQPSWDRFHESGAHLTLDLMQQPPSPEYETILPVRDSSNKAEEECDLWRWNSFQGSSVV